MGFVVMGFIGFFVKLVFIVSGSELLPSSLCCTIRHMEAVCMSRSNMIADMILPRRPS
jgi:hypothetical protein